MESMFSETIGVKHDLDLQRSSLVVSLLGHEKLLDPVEMNLLVAAPYNQWVLPESHLRRLREGEYAGSLPGTRIPASFWQHCKRSGDAALGRAFFAGSQLSMIHYAAFEKASNE